MFLYCTSGILQAISARDFVKKQHSEFEESTYHIRDMWRPQKGCYFLRLRDQHVVKTYKINYGKPLQTQIQSSSKSKPTAVGNHKNVLNTLVCET